MFFPGKMHGQRSLAGFSPRGYMTEHSHEEDGGRQVGSNKLVKPKKKKKKKKQTYNVGKRIKKTVPSERGKMAL